MRSNYSLAITLLLLSFSIQSIARSKLPEPPRSTITSVSQRMVLNGIPMDVRRFTSTTNVEKIEEFYRRKWPARDKDPGMLVNHELEPWTILSRLEDDVLMTVQMQSAGDGTEGILAVSSPNKTNKLSGLGKDIPKLPGSTVLSDLESDDVGKKGRVVMLNNRKTLSSNVSFYQQYYLDKDWTPIMDNGLDGTKHTLAFNDAGDKVNIVIMRSNRNTFVILNIEEAKWLF